MRRKTIWQDNIKQGNSLNFIVVLLSEWSRKKNCLMNRYLLHAKKNNLYDSQSMIKSTNNS